MSSSSSYSEVFLLAERVRDKFACQHGAKDQNLRLMIAHARLYDILDDHIESLKKRRRLSASKGLPYREAVAAPNRQDPFQINQQGRHHTRNRPGLEVTPPTVFDMPAGCAAEDDEDLETPSSPSSRSRFVELQTPNRKNKTSSPHGSPSLIETHCTKELNNSPYSADYKPQTVISETAISDSSDSSSNTDSNSDSDSDSDSNTDYDGDLDSDYPFPTQIIKGTLHPHIRQDHDSDEGCPNPSDILAQDPPKAEDFPTLQRFASSVTQASVESEPKTATTHAPPLSKTSPLAPLLCGDGSDISAASAIHHIKEQRLLQQALHQLLDHPRDDGNEYTSSITGTISRMFPSLAEWVRRKDGGKVGF
ncbi:MAG: hypothetical protein Q9171_004475 [Xanthocarpia ochracea]